MAQVDEPIVLESAPNQPLDTQPSRSVIGRSPSQIFWRRFRQDKLAIVGAAFVAFMIVIALAAPLIAAVVGHDPNELYIYEMTDEAGLPNGPTLSTDAGPFFFGADTTSRDLFVRVAYGARTSLTVAILATGLELLIGVSLGIAAGFYRGKTDTVISRGSDVVLSLPVILLALGIAAACGTTREGCLGGLLKPGLLMVAVIIGLFSWPYIARIVRGQVLSLREKEFIQASRSLGANDRRIMLKEVLPNLVAPIIVYATLIIPTNILFEAALSFLGIGIPPSIPSWGAMLDEASTAYTYAWWYLVFPGLFLLATTLAFNLVGDGLRDALDPQTAAAVASDE